jgi:hypothetical protein
MEIITEVQAVVLVKVVVIVIMGVGLGMINNINTNVGEMPLEIFGDYISDCLGMDFPWEYMFVPSALGYRSCWNHLAFQDENTMFGIGGWYSYRDSRGYGGGLFGQNKGYGVGASSNNSPGNGFCLNTGDSS